MRSTSPWWGSPGNRHPGRCSRCLCYAAPAALANVIPGAAETTDPLSHSSGGWKSEVMAPARLGPGEDSSWTAERGPSLWPTWLRALLSLPPRSRAAFLSHQDSVSITSSKALSPVQSGLPRTNFRGTQLSLHSGAISRNSFCQWPWHARSSVWVHPEERPCEDSTGNFVGTSYWDFCRLPVLELYSKTAYTKMEFIGISYWNKGKKTFRTETLSIFILILALLSQEPPCVQWTRWQVVLGSIHVTPNRGSCFTS